MESSDKLAYLTPNFLESFDVKGMKDREFMYSKLKYMALRQGFRVTPHQMPGYRRTHLGITCNIGSKVWSDKLRKNGVRDVPAFTKCPFFAIYQRDL